jgi:hypothetical protein
MTTLEQEFCAASTDGHPDIFNTLPLCASILDIQNAKSATQSERSANMARHESSDYDIPWQLAHLQEEEWSARKLAQKCFLYTSTLMAYTALSLLP